MGNDRREITPSEKRALDYIERLDAGLAAHVKSTRDFALRINREQSLGLEEEKVALAALCHDLARLMPVEEIIKGLESRGIEPESLKAAAPILLHGPLSAEIAREETGIEDEDVLSAIRFHATGSGEMSMLERLIYIADKVEPLREFDGAERLRKRVGEDVNAAFIEVICSVVKWIIARKEPLDYNSIAAYNMALREMEETGEGR